MVRFNVSSLAKARLGTSITLNVDTGLQTLADSSAARTDNLVEPVQALVVDFLCGTIRVTRVTDGLFVQGTVESRLELECVRCLEPLALPITLDLEETFRLPGASPKADAPYTVSADGWLDLSPLLQEQVWLAIPMKPVCDPGCKGLCPKCGVNLNLESCTCESESIDPRLALLKELL
jgi:uncharacterized protein